MLHLSGHPTVSETASGSLYQAAVPAALKILLVGSLLKGWDCRKSHPFFSSLFHDPFSRDSTHLSLCRQTLFPLSFLLSTPTGYQVRDGFVRFTTGRGVGRLAAVMLRIGKIQALNVDLCARKHRKNMLFARLCLKFHQSDILQFKKLVIFAKPVFIGILPPNFAPASSGSGIRLSPSVKFQPKEPVI